MRRFLSTTTYGFLCLFGWQFGRAFGVEPQVGNVYKVTAYCSCEICCGKWSKVYPRRTANGHIVKPGDKFVAAPVEMPFGTRLIIPGYSDKPVPVLDRGGAIIGQRIDVYFDNHQAALNFGVQYLKVERAK